MKFLIINGPNLNMLGVREPVHYGSASYSQLLEKVRAYGETIGVSVTTYQSNHEGDLVERIQQAHGRYDGIVINPGAYTHTSVALLDALQAVRIPAVEIHISKVEEREDFRQVSYVRCACFTTVTGEGTDGYLHAMDLLKQQLSK